MASDYGNSRTKALQANVSSFIMNVGERLFAKERRRHLCKIEGSIAAASSLQMTDAGAQYDKESKAILSNREFLAVILWLAVPEFADMAIQDVVDCIDEGSISRVTEISPGRTNKNEAVGINPEFNVLHEALSRFDVLFKVRNPKSSHQKVLCFLHVNIEPQKNFKPGYPIEKRGVYHMARMISSQFDVLTEKTDYGALEKVYSIFICQDRVPKELRNTVNRIELANVWSSKEIPTNKADFDLMSLIIVRLGNPDDESDEGIVRFLNALIYARNEKSYEVINEYVDFSDSLKMEVEKVMGISEAVIEYGMEKGMEKGIEKEKTEVALTMHQKGFALEVIAECLKTTVEKIEEIIKGQKLPV